MVLFLLSESFVSIKKNGKTKSYVITKQNSFLDNLKDKIKGYSNLVFICNDPAAHKHNKSRARMVAKAFKKDLQKFNHFFVLDQKTIKKAPEILQKADVIYLTGGKLEKQNQFLNDINFTKNLKNKDVVLIGKSAGAMNLEKVAYKYPEEDAEIGQQLFTKGQNLCDVIIITHFNKTKGNEFTTLTKKDILKDYYLPDSIGRTFYALPQNSYIMVEGKTTTTFGETYKIQNGKITMFCKNEEKRQIK